MAAVRFRQHVITRRSSILSRKACACWSNGVELLLMAADYIFNLHRSALCLESSGKHFFLYPGRCLFHYFNQTMHNYVFYVLTQLLWTTSDKTTSTFHSWNSSGALWTEDCKIQPILQNQRHLMVLYKQLGMIQPRGKLIFVTESTTGRINDQ